MVDPFGVFGVSSKRGQTNPLPQPERFSAVPGSATVSVAAIGVSPMVSCARMREPIGAFVAAFDLVGGTPTSAGETSALPGTN